VIHDLAEERCRLWQKQAVAPTVDRSIRIEQLTKLLDLAYADKRKELAAKNV
jgi:hypothetical protein